MSRISAHWVAIACALVIARTGALGAEAKEIDLPEHPVCEASAALEVPCLSHPGKQCIWIADNEQSDHLFEYEANEKGRLSKADRWMIPLGEEVSDIEALVKDGDAILAVGSHGRNKSCEFKKKRARVARISANGSTIELVAGAKNWTDDLTDCKTWIALPDDGDAARSLREAACETIVKEEEAAGKSEGDSEKCKEKKPLNIEGAVSVPGSGGSARVWLGLRAPVVDGKAILLRLAPLSGPSEKRITIDGIAAIDLGGKGIRELTTSDGQIWGIAGTELDLPKEDGFLWRVKEDQLKNGATIPAGEVKKVGDPLPPTSEGLVVQPQEKRAIVIVDGDLGDENECKSSSQQLVVKLP
jgi:hypothetical protein